MRKNNSPQKPAANTFKIADYQRPGIPNDEIAQLKEAFDLFDSNGSGSINPKQLKAAMITQGFETTSPTLFHVISEIISTNVSSIDFSGFIDIMTANSGVKVTKKSVKKVFGLFDDENTGFLSVKNLRKIIKELNLNLSQNELQTLIEKADIDRDGLVSEEQFYSIMSK